MMNEKPSRLGRGLAALIGDMATSDVGAPRLGDISEQCGKTPPQTPAILSHDPNPSIQSKNSHIGPVHAASGRMRRSRWMTSDASFR